VSYLPCLTLTPLTQSPDVKRAVCRKQATHAPVMLYTRMSLIISGQRVHQKTSKQKLSKLIYLQYTSSIKVKSLIFLGTYTLL
jgi:hypothetical protein